MEDRNNIEDLDARLQILEKRVYGDRGCKPNKTVKVQVFNIYESIRSAFIQVGSVVPAHLARLTLAMQGSFGFVILQYSCLIVLQ